MSAYIERDFDFQAGVYFQNTFLMNVYSLTLYMEVNTESMHEQNVAMDRIKYMIYECFENCIFVSDQDTEIIQKYQDAGFKLCIIPDEPYDQIISLLVILKLNSVCENRLKVSEITLTSKLSDEVKFKECLETAQVNYPRQGWWNDASPKLSILKNSKKEKEKVVKIKNNEWKNSGLVWKEVKEISTEILFNIDPEK